MLFAIAAAAQLSAADLTDLRCVYVFQTAAQALTGEDRWVMTTAQRWFEGRLAGRHPDLLVTSYVEDNFVGRKVAVGDADLYRCNGIVTKWQTEELKVEPHK